MLWLHPPASFQDVYFRHLVVFQEEEAEIMPLILYIAVTDGCWHSFDFCFLFLTAGWKEKTPKTERLRTIIQSDEAQGKVKRS